jgi:hypothetical protein
MRFTQGLLEWGQQLGLPDLVIATDTAELRNMLHTRRGQEQDGAWEQLARMSSTRDFASIIQARENFYQFALEALRRSRLGLRVFLLAIRGSLAQSYLKSRSCPSCGVKYDFVHFISCPSLGDPLLPALTRLGGDKDWVGFVSVI